MWERVEALSELAPRRSDLEYHRLHLVAAARLRARGETVPDWLRPAERLAAAVTLSGPMVLRRIRSLTDAPLLVMKGPEAAAHWPDPRLRPWKDLDVLTADPHALQRTLLAAGFVEIDKAAPHHLPALGLPGLPLTLEVHTSMHWPTADAPTFQTLMETARPCACADVPGVFAPATAQHAVLLAAHAWQHDPLSRIGQLADIAALTLAAGRADTRAVARGWGIERVWDATLRAADRLLLAPPPRRAPIWHRHLHDARERTVFEDHVKRVVGPLAEAPPRRLPAAAAAALVDTFQRGDDEGWLRKLRRSRAAVRNASMRRSDHMRRTS